MQNVRRHGGGKTLFVGAGIVLAALTGCRDIEDRMPTEIQLTERHEFELSEEGFMGLVYLKGSDQACFLPVSLRELPQPPIQIQAEPFGQFLRPL